MKKTTRMVIKCVSTCFVGMEMFMCRNSSRCYIRKYPSLSISERIFLGTLRPVSRKILAVVWIFMTGRVRSALPIFHLVVINIYKRSCTLDSRALIEAAALCFQTAEYGVQLKRYQQKRELWAQSLITVYGKQVLSNRHETLFIRAGELCEMICFDSLS